MKRDASLWIFGYGSLVWRPAFAHRTAQTAWIAGHVRRFWQGSTDHRGLPGRPGRVVTIVPEDHPSLELNADERRASGELARCWGTAYQVTAAEAPAVLEGLDHRERGGYERLEVDIWLTGPDATDERPVPGLVYVAGPGNDNYLGPAPLDAIAQQVSGASGPSGANADYVYELAAALRRMQVDDPHVFELEAALRRLAGDPRD